MTDTASGLPPAQTVSTGFVVAIVGFFSSFPIVLHGLDAMGADHMQAASGLMAASLSMGIAGILLSLWTKQPVSVAWSTPGAALLAISAAPPGGFDGAVGAFLIAGLLTLVAGLFRPLGRLAASIPAPLAQAMLSGVLFSICIVPFQAVAATPWTTLPIVLTWFIMGRINRLVAVPAAVLMAAFVVLYVSDFSVPLPNTPFTQLHITWPTFSVEATLGIALPLFIVTMATQNIPGIAVMKSYGYTPSAGPLLSTVGAASMMSSLIGAPATCLAAITAAMCSNDESHPNPAQRYWSAAMAGLFYCLLGIFAAIITAFAAAAPPLVLGTLAGIALLGVFANSAQAALDDAGYREAAAITFLITASGITVFGLGGAVWGLIAGGIVQLVKDRQTT
ncbi:benzoate/H(+) symporter BenE family transporter [uncultured Roseovarius sp.]|uniref:benzoate/H(+) symporter BenE family transporter n=1 Tax=uncultured Roseovarius sp. TaxID=293344 RepID=UPI00262FB417|nr:benzoate/H(+) symporter BenE family transporter [uncultured Roseovarius sp.]